MYPSAHHRRTVDASVLETPRLAISVAEFRACASPSSLVTSLALLVPTPAHAMDADRRAGELASTGYILGGTADRIVERDAHGLATLGIDGVGITPDGRDVALPDRQLKHLVRTAHENGLRAELLVHNVSEVTGDFDPKAAAALLRHPQAAQGRGREPRVVRRGRRLRRRPDRPGVDVEEGRPRAGGVRPGAPGPDGSGEDGQHRDDGLDRPARVQGPRLPARPARRHPRHDRADDLRPARSRLVGSRTDRRPVLAARGAGDAVRGRGARPRSTSASPATATSGPSTAPATP